MHNHWSLDVKIIYILGKINYHFSLLYVGFESESESESESELHYAWQFSAHQLVLTPSPLRPRASIIFSAEHLGL
jgi:hypothetical protein